MEITVFKVKSCNLPVLTFNHPDLYIFSYKSPLDTNSILLDSWLEDLETLQLNSYDFLKHLNQHDDN